MELSWLPSTNNYLSSLVHRHHWSMHATWWAGGHSLTPAHDISLFLHTPSTLTRESFENVRKAVGMGDHKYNPLVNNIVLETSWNWLGSMPSESGHSLHTPCSPDQYTPILCSCTLDREILRIWRQGEWVTTIFLVTQRHFGARLMQACLNRNGQV